ncbi:ATP-dependent helicase [Acanthocystis turfacea Chlorella virus GM0701.1]|nr:ATP-dependent helicase [Acanthocystis turfacea Chlorella virus GM0701.1]
MMRLLSSVVLMPHQIDALRWMESRENDRTAPGGILALDMGLGKTLLTIATVVAKPVKTLIIVPTSIVPQWVSEFEKFTGVTPFVADATMSNQGLITKEVLAPHNVVISPNSAFANMRNPLFLDCVFDRVVVDEAHLIRNPKTNMFKHISAIESDIKWCLTGTPIIKNEKNFEVLLRFLGIIGVPTRIARQKFVYRQVKEDVVKMPPLVVEELRSDFRTEGEKKAYADTLDDGRAVFAAYGAYGDGQARMEVLKIILRLRQCTGNICMVPYYDDPDTFYEGESTKLKMLEEDILGSPMQKTIIFTHFHKEMDYIAAMLKSHGFSSARLDGRVSAKGRISSVESFNEDPECNFLLVQIDAGGVGLNLQVAKRIYITSVHWNASSEIQAIARSYRIGQDSQVTVKRLIINNTVDDAIVGIQQKKLECAAELLEDHRIKSALSKRSASEFKMLTDVIFKK